MTTEGLTGRSEDDRIWRAFKNAPIAMLIFDEEARLQSMNDAARAVVGGRDLGDMPRPGDVLDCVNAHRGDGCGTNLECRRCALRAALNLAVRDGEEVSQREAALDICGEEPPQKHYYLVSTVISDASQGREILISLLDVTGMKEAELHLQQVNRKLSILGSFTRHDVLNQATAVMGYLELLGMTASLDEKQTGYMARAVSSLEGIVSYMDFNRNYQELGSKAPRWQDLTASIMEAHGHWTSMGLHMDPALAGLEILADPLISRAFYNLMDNSSRHGGGVSRIDVSLEEDEGGCSIVWEDDGVGVAPEIKERMFEQGVGRNTGLGLFLVREILSMTGISIIEDGVPGEGARFRIRTPAANCRRA